MESAMERWEHTPVSVLRVGSSVAQTVFEHLKDEIIAGAIPAGTRLHQADLAEKYGVSITPIREALTALASNGFADSNPHVGSVVHQPTLKELDEIYELRATLVPLMVERSIANISERDIERASEIASRISRNTIGLSWAEANAQFHSSLDGACDNRQLLSTMRHLSDLSRAYVALSVASSDLRRTRANDEHEALVELYRARDVRAAVEVTLQHIATTHDLVHSILEDGEAVS